MGLQLAFLAVLYVVGLVGHLSLARRLGPTFWALFALPAGALWWVAASGLFLLVRLPLTLEGLLFFLAVVSLTRVALAWRKGWRPEKQGLAAVMVVSCVHVAAATLVHRFDYTMMSSDGFIITYLGRSLAESGGFHPLLSGILPEWGMFTVLMQAPSFWLGLDYLPLPQPLLSLSFVGLLGWTTWKATRSKFVAGAAAALLGTSLFYVFNTFYVHNGLPAGLYLFLAFTGFWQAEGDRESAWLEVAWAGVVGLVLARPEGAVLASVVVIATACTATYHRGRFLGGAAAVTAVALCWYAQLGSWSDDSSKVMSPMKAALIAAPMLGVVAVAALSGTKADVLRRWSGRLLLLAVAVGLVVAFSVVGDPMWQSLSWLGFNTFYTGRWGMTTSALAATIPVASLIGAKVRREESFRVLLVTAPLFFLLMGSMRVPYRHGWGDTANRMLLHVFPLAVLYVALKLGPVFTGRDPTDRS